MAGTPRAQPFRETMGEVMTPAMNAVTPPAMTREDRLCLLLARGRLTPEVRTLILEFLSTPLQWALIMERACSHQVYPLLYRVNAFEGHRDKGAPAVMQGKDKLLTPPVHGDTAGRLRQEAPSQFGKKFDALRPRVGHDAPAGRPQNKQIVGQETMARVQEACRQAGLPKATAAQQDCGFPIDHDRGGMERFKTLLDQSVRKRVSQQVYLERLCTGLITLPAGDSTTIGRNQTLSTPSQRT
jgi:hypothetical protein